MINMNKMKKIISSAVSLALAFVCMASPVTGNSVPRGMKTSADNVTNGTVVIDDVEYLMIDGVRFLESGAFTLYQYPVNNPNESYTVPYGTKHIDYSAFKKCNNLKTIVIPNSVTNIYDAAFMECENLTDVQLSENIKCIDTGVFMYCKNLKKITIPSKVKCIESYGFGYCSGLEKVVLPEGLTKICEEAFFDCKNLKSINIPKSVTEIEPHSCGYGIINENDTERNPSKFKDFTINCYEGSCAEEYAKENGFIYHTHTFTKKETRQPTCTEKGVITYTCTCGETYYETTADTGHKYVKKQVVQPTCSSKGYTEYECSVCKDIFTCEFVPALVSLKKANVYGITNATYTGKQIKPVIKVTMGKTQLQNDRDYTVSYGTNKIGKATVTITGKGKYGDTINRTFAITPRKTTFSVKSKTKGKITVQTAKRPEAEKYQIQYSSNSKFKGTKTITTTDLQKTFTAKSKKIYYVRVRTVNGKYVSGWSGVRKIKVK